MSGGLVLHDLGDPDGGALWRAALATGGFDAWTAPDLPGHGSAAAPRTGHYDPLAVADLVRPTCPPVVVGVGENAMAALLLAAGDACEAVVVVDGLHGRFQSAADEVDEMYERLRGIFDDPAAHGPAPVGSTDPRTAHGYGISVSPPFLQRFWAGVQVPVLVVETPDSLTPVAERATRASWFAGPTRLIEVTDGSPAAVLASVGAFPGQG